MYSKQRARGTGKMLCWFCLFTLIKGLAGRVTFQNVPGGVLVLSTREGSPINTTLATLEATTDESGKAVYYNLQDQKYLDVELLTGRVYNIMVLDAEMVDYINVIAEAYTDPAKRTTLQVFVEIEDINDNKPVFTETHYVVNAKEDLGVGSFVTKVIAKDADDSGYVVTYEFDREYPKFRINKVSGSITIKERLDHETVQQYNVTVVATDSELSSIALLTINVLDTDDLGPSFSQSEYNVTITEGSYQIEKFLVQVQAHDGDLTVKSPVMYSLKEVALDTAILRINPNSGELFIKGTVDREVKQHWKIVVEASSTHHGAVAAVVNLNVDDVNEHKPDFPNKMYSGSIVENSVSGTYVMTVIALDADKSMLRYWIVESDHFIPFGINKNGQILVNGSIDRESRSSYSFKVKVEELYTTEKYGSETEVQIQIVDENDNSPVFPNPSITLTILENVPPPVYLYQFEARDEDIGENAAMEYFLTDATGTVDVSNGFAINSTGYLYTTKSFDREKEPIYTFDVLAQNVNNDLSLLRSGSMSVTVEILNVNDNKPIFQQHFYEAEMIETVRIGVVVTRVKAEDRDFGTSKLSYTFVNGSADLDFSINIETGVITTARPLNRELYSDYNLTIQVSDAGNHTDYCVLHVKVVDINDNGPVFENAAYHFNVPEEEDDVLVGQVKATDKDIGLAGVVRYELGNNQYFKINGTTGEIRTILALDREARGEHVFTVKAKDLAMDFRVSNVQVTVTVIDINDNRPIFTGEKIYSTVVQTSVALHTTLFTFKAFDKDIGDNAEVLYTSNQVPNFLTLNEITGDLKVSALIPANVERTRIQVIAANSKEPRESDAAILEIIFVSHKVDAPTFPKSVYHASVDENAPPNTVAINLDATYNNQPENTNFTYAITHGDLETFSIHQELGSIATLKRLDRETTDKYMLVVSVSLKGRETSNFATVNIQVNDLNDNPPVFVVNEPLEIEQKENLDLMQSLWKCHDDDVGNNALISYSVTGSDLISINQETGELSLKRPLDYETDPHVIDITITCFNHEGDPQLHSSVDLKVMVQDVNDNPPKFSQTEYRVEIDEYKFSSSLPLFTLNATDADEGMNGKITYKIRSIAPKSNCFNLHSSSGNLYVSCSLDRENISKYVIDVEARDSGMQQRSSTVKINVLVTDVNDQLPIFSKPEYSLSLLENKNASEVGLIDVTDGDEGQPCQYCVIYDGNDEGSFEISVDGTISSTKRLDRESKDSFRLTIRAYMHHPSVTGENPFSSCIVTITITDVNDNAPLFLKKDIIAGVLNTSPYGNVITTLNAIDGDKTPKFLYSVVSGNDENNFYLDSVTGVLTAVRDIVSKISSVFTLTVEVSNDNEVVSGAANKDTTTVRLIVFDQTSIAKFSVSQNASFVRDNKESLEYYLSNTTQYHVIVYQIGANIERAVVSCYGIDVTEMKMVTKDSMIESLRNHSLLNSFWNITPIEIDPDSISSDEDTERQLLIGIILGVSVLVVGLIMLAVFLWLRGEQRKRKRHAKTVDDGTSYKDNDGFVPNGNRYYVEPYESSDMYGTTRSNDIDEDLPKTFLQDPNATNTFNNPAFIEEEGQEPDSSETQQSTNIQNNNGSNSNKNKQNGGQIKPETIYENLNGNFQGQGAEENRTNANPNAPDKTVDELKSLQTFPNKKKK